MSWSVPSGGSAGPITDHSREDPMRRKPFVSGAASRHWIPTVALVAALACTVGAWAAPGTKAGTGKSPAAKEAADKETPKAKGVELVVQVNDDAGKPLRGAAVSVVIDELEVEQRSNGSGQAKFRDLPAGAARVQAVATGWNSSGRVVTLTGERVLVDLALTPRKPPAGAGATASGAQGTDTHRGPKGSSAAASHGNKQTGGKVQTVEDDVPAVQPGAPAAPDTEATTGGHGADDDTAQ
jgi:hypothetical protein